MKKFLILLIALLSVVNITAQTNIIRFKATAISEKHLIYNGYWSDWSPWQQSNVVITMNLNNDVITITSQMPQMYKIYTDGVEILDNMGKTIKFEVIDQDGDYGSIRLRHENSGRNQLYVDFADISWVYIITRLY